MELLHKVVDLCLAAHSSDIHLGTDFYPAIRIDGRIVFLDEFPAVTAAQMEALTHALLTKEQNKKIRQNTEVDFAFTFEGRARFRVNVYKERRGLNLALRYIPEKIQTMDDLGLPAPLKNLVSNPYGLVLVTGPTGSGKSTTVAAMIDYINETKNHHIITIEDPIEYLHKNKKSLIKQRTIGYEGDSASFPNALRAALREDPDVILVGEMRDRETTALAVTAAETGHLVISTLHTNNTYQAVNRIIDIFPSDQQQQIRLQVAQNLVGIIAKRLLPERGGGRTAALEILIGTSAVKTQIREAKVQGIPNTIKTCRSEGMILLEDSIQELVLKQIIDREVGQRFLMSQASY